MLRLAIIVKVPIITVQSDAQSQPNINICLVLIIGHGTDGHIAILTCRKPTRLRNFHFSHMYNDILALINTLGSYNNA